MILIMNTTKSETLLIPGSLCGLSFSWVEGFSLTGLRSLTDAKEEGKKLGCLEEGIKSLLP